MRVRGGGVRVCVCVLFVVFGLWGFMKDFILE